MCRWIPATGHTRFDVVATLSVSASTETGNCFLDTQVFFVVHADVTASRSATGSASPAVNGVAGAVTPLDGRVEHGYPMADDLSKSSRIHETMSEVARGARRCSAMCCPMVSLSVAQAGYDDGRPPAQRRPGVGFDAVFAFGSFPVDRPRRW